MQRFVAALAAFLLTTAMTPVVLADETSDAIELLRGVQPGSTDSAAARGAVQKLTNGTFFLEYG